MSDTEEPAADVEVSLSDTEPADDGGGGDLEAAMGLADEGDEAEAEPEPEPEPGNYSLLFFSLFFFFSSLFPSFYLDSFCAQASFLLAVMYLFLHNVLPCPAFSWQRFV